WLLVLEVILFAVDEHDNVRVLLDRARLAQVRKLRALVVATLHLTGQLRERKYRNVELLGQSLETGRNFRELLYATRRSAVCRPLNELQIVDDDEIEAALAFEPAGARGELGDGQTAGFVDVERQ